VSQEQLPTDAVRTFTYDAFNQLLTVQDQKNSGVMFDAATFSWNRDGNLATTTDGANHSTTRTYDLLGRFSSLTNGLGTTSYQYVSGTLMPVTIKEPSANITYTYNLAGRIASISIADSPGRDSAGNRSFQYSPLGFISSATESTTGGQLDTTDLSYDSLGRRITESDSLSGATIHTVYAPREKTISFSTGATTSSIDRRVDALGRPLALQVNGSQIAQWTYAAGALAAINYLGGTQVAFGYDAFERVISETAGNGTSAIASVNRSFGLDGIPHQYTLNVGTTPVETNYFMTDDAGRVIAEEAARPGVSTPPATLENSDVLPHLDSMATQYTLDGAANWLARSGLHPLNTVVDSANRYISINGETVQNTSGGGLQSFETQQYRWDGLNQLTSATVGANSRQWQYDALGRPASVKDGQGNSSRLIWDGDNPVGSVADGNSGNLTVFAGFSGQDVVALLGPGNSVSYLHHGPDQSVFAVTDSNGKLSQAYSYTAFGEPHIWNLSGVSADLSSPASPFLFQGAFYGTDLGLYRMGARTYAPALGRFLPPDPIGQLGGLNLFAFVGGRPLLENDPNGTNGRPAQRDVASLNAGEAPVDLSVIPNSGTLAAVTGALPDYMFANGRHPIPLLIDDQGNISLKPVILNQDGTESPGVIHGNHVHPGASTALTFELGGASVWGLGTKIDIGWEGYRISAWLAEGFGGSVALGTSNLPTPNGIVGFIDLGARANAAGMGIRGGTRVESTDGWTATSPVRLTIPGLNMDLSDDYSRLKSFNVTTPQFNFGVEVVGRFGVQLSDWWY
jgi:RHS repeat-associated protein